MHIIWTILIGFIALIMVKFVHPSKESIGFILTTRLGIGGSFKSTYAG